MKNTSDKTTREFSDLQKLLYIYCHCLFRRLLTLTFFRRYVFVEAALVIRGFAIRSFDYSRTRKQGKTMNNEGKNTVLAEIDGFGIHGPPRIARETCIPF